MSQPNWSESEALWAAYDRFEALEELEDAAGEQVEQLLALVGLQPPAAVLDLCCGIGRHAIELARRGFVVTAVDRYEPFLAKARRRAAEAGVRLETVQSDMRAFARGDAFDLAINLFTSFGYFDNDEEELGVLRNLHASLRPGGQLLLELHGKEVLARVFREKDWYSRDLPEGRAFLLNENRVADDWRRVESDWTFIWPDGGRETHRVAARCYTAGELMRLVEAAGFGEVRAFGHLDGSPYDRGARRLVVTGRKVR